MKRCWTRNAPPQAKRASQRAGPRDVYSEVVEGFKELAQNRKGGVR